MQRMQVYIPEKIFINLKSQALIREVSMSDLVREGLEKILKVSNQRADPMKEFVGQCKGKEKTNAVEEINKYYSLKK